MSGPEKVALAAEIYQEAWEAGAQPLQSVREALGTSRATAGRLIRAAREAGLLPKTDPYKPKGWGKRAPVLKGGNCPTCGASPSHQRKP